MMEPTIPEVLPADDQEQQQLVTTLKDSIVKFGRWQEAKHQLSESLTRTQTLSMSAAQLTVKDHESREHAGTINARLKEEAKNAEATLLPFESPLNRVLDFLRQKRQQVTNKCTESRGILARKMSEYDRAEEAKAAAERNRQQQAIDKETQAQAKKELKAGDIGKREFKERVENTPQVNVAPAIPKVAGNVRRINYSAFCTDKEKFIDAIVRAHGKDKELYLRLRECVLNAMSASVGQNKTALQQALSATARAKLKTNPQDDQHPLTVEQFKALYPFVEVREDRSY